MAEAGVCSTAARTVQDLRDAFDEQAAFAICVGGLRTFLRENFGDERKAVLLGLSGGIDSALVACLAAAAVGADNLRCVTLPGPHTTAGTHSDAADLAANLGCDFSEVAIKSAYEACARELLQAENLDVTSTIAGQNIQARLRMVMLMALSNAHGWPVLNTGNLSEACMGYCTLYGDTVGAYDPIGGLLKTEVYALADWINAHPDMILGAGASSRAFRGEALIPLSIITRPPSAELADGQTDEDSLGITYAELDVILAQVLSGSTPEEVAESGVADGETVVRVLAHMKANAFKRAWYPPHPAVLHG